MVTWTHSKSVNGQSQTSNMQTQIAMAKSFMESYSALPRKQQKSVRALLDKFQKDPESPGINYERIKVARDDKARGSG